MMCYSGRLVSTVERCLQILICCRGTTIQAPNSLASSPMSMTEHVSRHVFITVVQFGVQINCFCIISLFELN